MTRSASLLFPSNPMHTDTKLTEPLKVFPLPKLPTLVPPDVLGIKFSEVRRSRIQRHTYGCIAGQYFVL